MPSRSIDTGLRTYHTCFAFLLLSFFVTRTFSTAALDRERFWLHIFFMFRTRIVSEEW